MLHFINPSGNIWRLHLVYTNSLKALQQQLLNLVFVQFPGLKSLRGELMQWVKNSELTQEHSECKIPHS